MLYRQFIVFNIKLFSLVLSSAILSLIGAYGILSAGEHGFLSAIVGTPFLYGAFLLAKKLPFIYQAILDIKQSLLCLEPLEPDLIPKLTEYGRINQEIRNYLSLLSRMDRHPIRAEYEMARLLSA